MPPVGDATTQWIPSGPPPLYMPPLNIQSVLFDALKPPRKMEGGVPCRGINS